MNRCYHTLKEGVHQLALKSVLKKSRQKVVPGESRNFPVKELIKLTDDQKKQIGDLWNDLLPNMPTLYHRMFSSFEFFDSRWVSDDVYWPLIVRSLNSNKYVRSLENKSMYPILFPSIPQPRYLINKINGNYYDCEENIVEENEALKILQQSDGFIIKPTHDTLQGKNVRKIDPRQDSVQEIVKLYGDDFIAQEVLTQSKVTEKFNPHSVNSLRFTTLFLNGKVSLCSILFRCGQGTTCVDNGGAGGLMAGVEENGLMHDYAYDKFFKRYEVTKEGVRFRGTVIPNMPHIVELVKKWHKQFFPLIGIIGWDIALKQDDTPCMIEVNLGFPGIMFEQLCAQKPLFGDRTEEVITFVRGRHLEFKDVI